MVYYGDVDGRFLECDFCHNCPHIATVLTSSIRDNYTSRITCNISEVT